MTHTLAAGKIILKLTMIVNQADRRDVGQIMGRKRTVNRNPRRTKQITTTGIMTGRSLRGWEQTMTWTIGVVLFWEQGMWTLDYMLIRHSGSLDPTQKQSTPERWHLWLRE